MRTFRDSMERALDDMFRADIFAKYYIINGQQIRAIMEKDEYLVEKEYYHEHRPFHDGVYGSINTLYVKVNDLAKRPRVKENMIINNCTYKVIGCKEEEGIYVITLEVGKQ